MKGNVTESYFCQLNRSSGEYLSQDEVQEVFQTISRYETAIFSLCFQMEGFWQQLDRWLDLFKSGEPKKQRALINRLSRKTLENRQVKEVEIERVMRVILQLKSRRTHLEKSPALLQIYKTITGPRKSYAKFVDYLKRMVQGIEADRWGANNGSLRKALVHYTGRPYRDLRRLMQLMSSVRELDFENRFYYQECLVELQTRLSGTLHLQGNKRSFHVAKAQLEEWCGFDFELIQSTHRHIMMYQRRINRIYNAFSQRYLHYVVFIAKKFRNSNLAFADILQEGNIGLLRAVRKYDYTIGAKFLSYAVYWIKQRIFKAIADQARTIRIPVYIHNEYQALKRLMEQRQKEPGKDPDVKRLAADSGKSEGQISNLMGLFRNATFSLDNELPCESKATLLSFVPDLKAVDPVTRLEKMALKDEIYQHLDRLPPRELQVLEMRYGLRNGDRHTLEEVARKFRVSRERIRQLEERALSRLKKKGNERLRPYLYCN